MSNQDTICALSTAPGVGGLAVVRVSGPEAFSICDRVFVPVAKSESNQPAKHVNDFRANTCHFGRIVDAEGQVLDEVVLSLFRAPRSYTGEDVVELSCHGSLYIQQSLVRLLIANGCRHARAGEFTQRAFLNGKMDLSQAEAVADLIAAESESASRIALKQMRGGFSDDLLLLRTQLLRLVSLLELELDFSEEEVEFADRNQLTNLCEEIEQKLVALCDSFRLGNVIKNGIPVAIVGETNAGKSTLLNLLLHEDKAIVSAIHGTTRDSIEDCICIQGVNFRFIDTAGLRDTKDEIERIGIERTYQKIDQASIVLWLIDSTQVSDHIEALANRLLPRLSDKKWLLIFNKKDKITAEEEQVISHLFEHFPGEHFHMSAKTRENADVLEQKLIEMAQLNALGQTETIVTNLRHYEALNASLISLRRARQALLDNLSGDLVAQDLRETLYHLGLITGQITTDEVLGEIFGKFCVGK